MKSHVNGELETMKFDHRRKGYGLYIDQLLPNLDYKIADFVEYWPAFTGHMTLNRYLALYELYKKVLGVAGHISEVGVYKGAGSLLFAKLCQIFEPESLTMVHGFDWFQGTEAVPENPLQVQNGNSEDENRLRALVSAQNLDNILKIHKLDVSRELPQFFEKHPHLRFKLVFLDSGTFECVSECIKYFWPRLNVGGVMVFDQYANEVAPGETRSVHELLPNQKIETISSGWMACSYTTKG